MRTHESTGEKRNMILRSSTAKGQQPQHSQTAMRPIQATLWTEGGLVTSIVCSRASFAFPLPEERSAPQDHAVQHEVGSPTDQIEAIQVCPVDAAPAAWRRL